MGLIMTSSTLDSPVTSNALTADSNRTRTMLAIALVSFSSLLLELGLTRLFSVVLFYHFAFLAISVALLGLGAGGVFAHLFRARLARHETARLGAWLCLLNALVMMAV